MVNREVSFMIKAIIKALILSSWTWSGLKDASPRLQQGRRLPPSTGEVMESVPAHTHQPRCVIQVCVIRSPGFQGSPAARVGLALLVVPGR